MRECGRAICSRNLTETSGRPISAGWHGHCRLTNPGGPAVGLVISCTTCWIWAWTLSRANFGERIPTDVVYFSMDPIQRKCTIISLYLYNKTVFDLLREVRRRRRCPVVFARSATNRGQQFPVHWGGDNSATFESMAESLRVGCRWACRALNFGATILVASNKPLRQRYNKRWCAFGLLSSHSRFARQWILPCPLAVR